MTCVCAFQLDLGRVIERNQFSQDAAPAGYFVREESPSLEPTSYPLTETVYEPEPESAKQHQSFSNWSGSTDPRNRPTNSASDIPVLASKYEPYGTSTRGIACAVRGRDDLEKKLSIGVGVPKKPTKGPDFTALKQIGDSMGTVADSLEVHHFLIILLLFGSS